MRWNGKIPICLCCAILGALFLPTILNACSLVYREVHVGTAFRVRVTNHDRPIPSLRLVLSRSNSSHSQNKFVAVTDSKGYAYFRNISVGSFFLTPDHDAGIEDGLTVNVTSGGPTNSTVSLSWPGIKPLPVRTASGVLRLPSFYPSETQESISLSLSEGVSTRVFDTTLTDKQGHFRFADAVPPGIYFLQLGSSQEGLGAIAIEISAEADKSLLDLDLAWTSCGLTYAQRDSIPEITTAKVCGSVTDTAGTVVSDADVMLFSTIEGKGVLDQIHSDGNGRFMFNKQPYGTYRLLVKRAGFRPFLGLIHIEPSEASDHCQQPIEIKLDVI